MATDELVVSIRYQADLQSFKDSISIAERQTNDAVARMTAVLGGLHQPFQALFERLSTLQETASAFTLPDSQIERLDSLTQKLADKTGTLSANLKEITGSLQALAPQIQETINPLADRQLEKNLEALAKLMDGVADGGRSGPSIAERVGTGAALVGLGGAAATAIGAPLTLTAGAALFALGYSIEDIVGLSEDLAGKVQDLVASQKESVPLAEDLLGRFSNIASFTEQWAGSQERISKALEPAVEAYADIENSLKSIKDNAADLPTFGFGSGTGGGGILRQPRGSTLRSAHLAGRCIRGWPFWSASGDRRFSCRTGPGASCRTVFWRAAAAAACSGTTSTP